GSVEAAKSAVSCCRWLAENIVEDKIPNAFALVRPPGHHADRYSACGFCLFNNAAQAAEAAFNFGADRMSYKTGCGDADYMAIHWNVLMPLAREFNPDFVIVSAGFDSCDGDPLGGMHLSPDAYSHIVYHLSALAHGKLLLLLEGGYNHSVQSVGVHRCLRVLCGYKPLPLTKLGPPKDRHHPTVFFEPPKDEEKENTGNIMQENLFKSEWTTIASAPAKMLLVHNGDSSKHYSTVEDDHPEVPARTQRIMAKLESCGLISKCEVLLNERTASDAELEAVHERPYIQKMRRSAEMTDAELRITEEGLNSIYLTRDTFSIASRSVGAVLEIAMEVCE
ncbi:unnamed protein product, partial [Strongylus vulgaris]